MPQDTPQEKKRLRKYISVPSQDGRRHRTSVSGYTERELEANYRAKLKELAKSDFRFTKSVSVGAFFPHFLEIYVRPNMRENTFYDEKKRLERHFINRYGHLELNDITAPMLQQILNENKGKSKSFLTKLRAELTAFFNAADDEELLNRNPTRRLFLPASKTGDRRALTHAERKAFINSADQHKHGLLFLIIYYCGLRPGEVRALTYNDIDLENRTITVSKSLEERSGNLKDPKTKSGNRTVPIPDELFKRLPRKRGNAFLFLGDQSGKPISTSTYKRAWNTILNLMDIEMGAKRYRNKIIPSTSVVDRALTPYYLRHTYCTILAERDVDIKTAQYLMGHSSITVTANIYQHVTNRMLEKATKKISGM